MFVALAYNNQKANIIKKVIEGVFLMKDDVNNNYDYTCGVSDDELSYRFKEAVKIENEINDANFNFQKILICI